MAHQLAVGDVRLYRGEPFYVHDVFARFGESTLASGWLVDEHDQKVGPYVTIEADDLA